VASRYGRIIVMNLCECDSFGAGLGHYNGVFVEEVRRYSVSTHCYRADLEPGTVPITVRSLPLCKLAWLYNIISIAILTKTRIVEAVRIVIGKLCRVITSGDPWR
jgi:hypothetical protein